MTNETTLPATVDEYISDFPAPVKKRLVQLRKTIKACAPSATEGFGYGMPGFKYLGRPLVYFAAYENHIGFYATPTGHEKFKQALSSYKTGKGSVQFPHSEPFPLELVKKIVLFRVKENEALTAAKKKPVAVKSKKAVTPANKDEEAVKTWMNRQEPAVRKEIDTVRRIIKKASPKLNERIKWNAPSYYYMEDILTFGPYKKNKLLLVVHHPSVEKIRSPLLEGNFKGRRLIWLKNGAEAVKQQKELTRIIRELVKAVGTKK
ncbi:MAG: DUF1801 domain-containing protein [Sphingobacteriales bacterium]|nr:DUF1801 domain-containing protein [Sphingobacteriales bacterium]